MLNDYVTVADALDILEKKLGKRYNRSYISTLVANGEQLRGVKIGRDWLIDKQSLREFNPSPRGLKTGQKINRRSKHEKSR